MNNKTLVQVFLILLALSLSVFFYFNYFYKKDFKKSQIQESEINSNSTNSIEGTTIKEILYENYDNEGNRFVIKSETGVLSKTNKDDILMVNVTAKISLINGNDINLTSKNASYNPTNSNTNFFDDVSLVYLDHKVNADIIDVIFTENKIEAYNNLIYRNSDINLRADKVELDLLTKNTKIFMFDNSKVKIIKD
ncbi:hypothetical protein OAN68_02490 [Candidatus Pelagibacter sp.]|nr:hypothetical protein [Candidatus Pelagibacter sp.]